MPTYIQQNGFFISSALINGVQWAMISDFKTIFLEYSYLICEAMFLSIQLPLPFNMRSPWLWGFTGSSTVMNPPAMQEAGFNPWVGKIPWRRDRLPTPVFVDFPGGSESIESACNAGDSSSIPGWGRSPGAGHGNPHQYSCLENPAWTDEPGGLQSTGSQRVRYNWVTKHSTQYIGWRKMGGEKRLEFKWKTSFKQSFHEFLRMQKTPLTTIICTLFWLS